MHSNSDHRAAQPGRLWSRAHFSAKRAQRFLRYDNMAFALSEREIFKAAPYGLGGFMKELLAETAARAARYLAGSRSRQVAPRVEDIARLNALGGVLPQAGSDPAEVLSLLDDLGSRATVTTTGGRYFGFVIGGTLPAALAANWLAGAWDQNAAFSAMSPVSAKIEEVVLRWVCEALGLPAGCAGGLVTCATMANLTALATALPALLAR